MVNPRSSPAVFKISSAYRFLEPESSPASTVSSQLNSKSSALFRAAIHMSGLNQHIAAQNTRKNFDQTSPRQIWTISWRRISRSSSSEYGRSGSSTQVAQGISPTVSGVFTLGAIPRQNFGFTILALFNSSYQTSIVRGSGSRTPFKSQALNRRWETTLKRKTPANPASQTTAKTQISRPGTRSTKSGDESSILLIK